MELTGLQKMQAAYAHFTLEEWQYIVQCVRHHTAAMHGTKLAMPVADVNEMLCKFPSAVL